MSNLLTITEVTFRITSDAALEEHKEFFKAWFKTVAITKTDIADKTGFYYTALLADGKITEEQLRSFYDLEPRTVGYDQIIFVQHDLT